VKAGKERSEGKKKKRGGGGGREVKVGKCKREGWKEERKKKKWRQEMKAGKEESGDKRGGIGNEGRQVDTRKSLRLQIQVCTSVRAGRKGRTEGEGGKTIGRKEERKDGRKEIGI
jgi:hypothetical protein